MDLVVTRFIASAGPALLASPRRPNGTIRSNRLICGKDRSMPLDLSTRRVMVTGGSGFVGRRVVAKLRERGARDVFVPRSADYNLVDRDASRRVIRDSGAQVIIHLAAVAGGIGVNMQEPGRFFFDNLMMGTQLM